MSANPDPNPVLHQVMIRKQYDGKRADVWSCGVGVLLSTRAHAWAGR